MKDMIKLIKLISEFLDGLSEEELLALTEKKARLKIELPRNQKSIDTALTEKFFQELDSLTTRDDAKSLFERYNFRKSDLKIISKHYGIFSFGNEKSDQLIDKIIESVVGSKLKYDTLLTTNLHDSK